MITDQEVVNIFRYFSSIPLGLSESEKRSKNSQLYRGERDTYPHGCGRHMEIFKRFEVIPEYCFDCYKVIIAPRNVLELFKLFMVFEKISLPKDTRRKCMVEERNDCSGTYKGFVYCMGLKEGNEVLKIVENEVFNHISPQVSVTLKRGCSEYAQKYPRFPRTKSGRKPNQHVMQYKESWKAKEEIFDRHYSVTDRERPPDTNDNTYYTGDDGVTKYSGREVYCMQYWLKYAATIGDESYLSITGEALPPIPRLHRKPFKKQNE